MAELPTGTVTFLFTDIEGSTRLWEQHPAAMRTALARHHTVITSSIQRHGGIVVKSQGEGDSFFAVFARPTEAVAAASALQRSLLSARWPPEAPLRVRVAIHTGEAELRDGDYYGRTVNRCARLRSAAHGGQVLLSGATQELLQEALPADLDLRDLGRHHLRDLQRPEHVFQLVHPDLPADFPPLASLGAFPNNLPLQVTSFVGRALEIEAVQRHLVSTRLLTLTGAGGTGKTRLALQAAADVLPHYPDGVWLVELAPISDPTLVPQTVASVVGVREQPGRPLSQTLVDALRMKRLLLLLDNCEHLLDACATLADSLLRHCPGVGLLATSRETLNIPGETTYRLPSLAVPDPRHLPRSSQSLVDYESARLFLDRATAFDPRFTLTDENALAIAQVCSRLDGIPLAIELAAARVRAMPVEKIAERLDDRFRLLTGGSRTALPRQQTLRATLDWSYDLLGVQEQRLLRRASVFAGGWTLPAAEHVCAGEELEAWEVLDLLPSLVDKSLVLFEQAAGSGRYRLFETMRQYGQERLAEEERTATRRRHAEYFLTLAEETPLAQIAAEHDNIRLALDWYLTDPSSAEASLRLATRLSGFWRSRGLLMEARARLGEALTHGGTASPRARAGALQAAGWIGWYRADFRSAQRHFEESLGLYRELGQQQSVAVILRALGVIASQCEPERADYGKAGALLEEALALSRALEAEAGIGSCLMHLGVLAHCQGDFATARRLLEESLPIRRRTQPGEAAMVQCYLGTLDLDTGDAASAEARYREGFRIAREAGSRVNIAALLEPLAWSAAALGRAERAARLFGIAHAQRADTGLGLWPLDLLQHERHSSAARIALGEEAFAAAWGDGRAMTLDDASRLALEECEIPVTGERDA